MKNTFIVEGGTELKPRYDKASSFYEKACVVPEGLNSVSLFSYGTKICNLRLVGCDDYEVVIYNAIDENGNNKTFSSTSLRHLKEFLKQNGLKAETKSQIKKDYESKEVYI